MNHYVIRRGLMALALVFVMCRAVEGQVKTVITGAIQDASGNPATSGYVEFRLAPASTGVGYRVTGTTVIAPQTSRCSIAVGALAGCSVWGNTVIQPASTCYDVAIAPGNVVRSTTRQLISGSTYDLSAPTFCPNVSVVPQYQTITTAPVSANLVPAATKVFNLGDSGHYYAQAYVDNLFINNFNGSPASMTVGTLNATTANITTLNAANLTLPPNLNVPGRLLVNIGSTDVIGGAIVAGGAIQSATGSTNASIGSIAAINGQYVAIASGKTGTGTFLPMAFFVGGTGVEERMRIETSGRILMGLTSSDIVGGSLVTSGAIQVVTGITNSSIGSLTAINNQYVALAAGKTGAGQYLPIALFTGGLEALRVDTAGRELIGLKATDVSGGAVIVKGAIQSVTTESDASIASIAAIAGSYTAIASGRTGAGTYLPIAFFTNGVETARMNVDRSTTFHGSITVADIPYVWPSVQGGASTFLQNDGAGNLTWAAGGGGGSVTSGTMVNHGLVYATGAAAIASTAAVTNGQLLIGSTGANPVAAALTAGANIAVTNGAGTITVALSGTVPIANGGTGTTGFTNNKIPYITGGVMADSNLTLDTIGTRLLVGLASSDVSGGAIVTNGAIQTATGVANASVGSFAAIPGSYVAFSSGKTGAGTALPLAFFTSVGGSTTNNMQLDNTNNATDTAMLLFFNGSLIRVHAGSCTVAAGTHSCLYVN